MATDFTIADQQQGASAKADRAATPAGPSPEGVSGVAGIPCAKKKKRWSNPKQFFIVFSPDGETPPKVVHKTHPDAFAVAALMAKRHPEKSFFVMGSMSARVTPREKAEATAEQVAA